MIKKTFPKIVPFFILLLISCRNDVIDRNKSEIVISLLEQENNTGQLEDYLILESVVPLETNDFCLIESIDRIILYDDMAFILNAKREVLIVNNKTGRYIGHIRSLGNGPGEYLQIMDIAFNEEKETIIIYSDTPKVLLYDLDFNYIEEINVGNKLYEKIICSRDLLYFYNPLSVSDKDMVSIYDLNKRKWNNTIGYKNYDSNFRYFGNPFVKSKAIWYTSPLENTLSKIKEWEAQNVYELDIKNFGKPDELIKFGYDFMAFYTYVNEEHICYALTSIRETSKSIFCASNRHPFIIIDKVNEEASYLQSLQDTSFGFSK